MKIIGISAYYHDSAVALIEDGRILYAAQEERFSRIKGDSSFPLLALKNLFQHQSLNPQDIDAFVFYDKPFLKFERLIVEYSKNSPRGYRSFRRAIPIWLKDKIFLKDNLARGFLSHFDIAIKQRLFFSEHHLSHAASAFFPSPFEEAAILTIDGVGEYATTSLSVGDQNRIKVLKEIHYPNSLGLLYSAFTYFCGFKVNSGEYKLMGLAPFGEPKYVSQIKNHLLEIKGDGSFSLNMKYFDFSVGLTMTNVHFEELFQCQARVPESHIDQVYMDLACSIQIVLEEILMNLVKEAARVTEKKSLVLAGGVALNCVANSKILESKHFDNIWIQPAAGDAGGAIGAALAYYYLQENKPRGEIFHSDAMSGAFLGPDYTREEILETLMSEGAEFQEISNTNQLLQITAKLLSTGKVVGWFQGRMEFGPRALGNRSILGDPRDPKMQQVMNQKIKFRESFRPFAPAVLETKASSYFDFPHLSPYMLFVGHVLDHHRYKVTEDLEDGVERIRNVRSAIPAVTHLDYSARLQTVHQQTNPRFFSLIEEFEKLTTVPLLINTSFNVRGEPIVCSPLDGYKCFMKTAMDVLVIGNFILFKDKNIGHEIKNYEALGK